MRLREKLKMTTRSTFLRKPQLSEAYRIPFSIFKPSGCDASREKFYKSAARKVLARDPLTRDWASAALNYFVGRNISAVIFREPYK